MIDEATIYQELREACKDVLEKNGIAPEHMEFRSIVSYSAVLAAIVRQEFSDMKRPGEGDACRQVIAKQHGVSVGYVCKMLYGQSRQTQDIPNRIPQ